MIVWCTSINTLWCTECGASGIMCYEDAILYEGAETGAPPIYADEVRILSLSTLRSQLMN